MISNISTILLLCLHLTLTGGSDVDTITINTPSGSITGLKDIYEETGILLNEFRGIPYAKPPVGSLRFQKPQPFGKWEEVRDGTKFGLACMQPGVEFIAEMHRPEISEDCLFLNVYVPGKLQPGKKLSVMVWIHGGGFVIGHSNQYDGGRIATKGNVIVVTINYRLGVFGFLAVDHKAARGNYALWDQKLTLQWVQDNIGAFGGDPDSVTVFGESAGGYSASFQSLIPSNKGLFHRVIAQSGVVTRFTLLTSESINKNVKDISERSNCSNDDMYKFVECLRVLSAEDLLIITNPFAAARNDQIFYASIGVPVLDGELIKSNPIKNLQDENSEVTKFFQSLDFMTGTTSNEGSLIYMMLFPGIQEHYGFNVTEGISSEVTCQAILSPFVETYYNDDVNIKKLLCVHYYNDGSLQEQSLRATDAWADIMFYHGTNKMLEYHSSLGGRTYQYVVSKLSPRPLGGTPPEWFKGCGHGDECIYLFNVTTAFSLPEKVELTEEEQDLSTKMINYWTSFAKTGIPDGGEGSVAWKPFDTVDKAYLDLGVPITLKGNYKPEVLDFWFNQMPEVDFMDNRERDEL